MIDLLSRPWAKRAGRFLARNTRWAEISALFDKPPANLSEEVRVILASGWVEELVVRGKGPEEMLHVVVDCARAAGRRVRWVSDAAVEVLPAVQSGERWVREDDIESSAWVLVPQQRSRWQLAVKRAIDLVAALVLLIMLSPVLVATAVAVRLTSRGPVLYRWRVLGENGRPFVGFKFRTMVREADALKQDLLHLNERSGPVFKMARDPRVTPVGRWLRKYSADELPQLWSVLIGDMSLVGPRPPFASEYRDFQLWQMRKLSVKPGITCLWQINGRQTITDFADWARLDLDYIDRWSLGLDLSILWQTPVAIVKGTGH
jgi:lipopolysaccharide/colanic/teichoic acid biosynthesis glycosyltransferase